MAQARVTQGDLITGLRGLGVRAGDLIFVHASLSRFGHVEGGARTVIEALLAAIGPSGTLAMPGFTFGLREEATPVFDVRHSPCWTGRTYELFRTEVATHRSHHATHSVCAAGPQAAALTADHGPAPCGATSPFRKLAAWGGGLLLLGVGHNSNTTFHAVEEQEQLPYFPLRQHPRVTIIDEEGQAHPLPTLLHAPTRRYDFNRMNTSLWEAGLQREAFIGDSLVRYLNAGDMFEHAVQAVRRDPETLVELGGQRLQVPVGRVEGQMVYA
ncbi:AAC(3) family N-acetyltransferase [bacterium]|nr:AAC(3) family N-acetyltransferase [bacterium]